VFHAGTSGVGFADGHARPLGESTIRRHAARITSIPLSTGQKNTGRSRLQLGRAPLQIFGLAQIHEVTSFMLRPRRHFVSHSDSGSKLPSHLLTRAPYRSLLQGYMIEIFAMTRLHLTRAFR